MTSLQDTIVKLESAGRSITVDSLGGLDRVLKTDFRASKAFGAVTYALSNEWKEFESNDLIVERIAEGLEYNSDRLALRDSIDALLQLPTNTFRPFIFALERRTRADGMHPILQAEASAGLARFALADQQWRSIACASIQSHQAGVDPLADAMYCRLVSLAYDFFDFTEAISLLESYAELQTAAAQAKLERGLIEISLALSSASTNEIASRLLVAEKWLASAVEADDERRDTRSYHVLIRSVLSLGDPKSSELKYLVEELKSEAFVADLWDRPAPGMDWLASPSQALSAWVPVVESLTSLSNQINEPSWLDATGILEHVFHLYSVNRSVRPGSPNLGNYLRPTIEAAFVRERGLAAHLQQWLQATPSDHLQRSDAERLQANITRYTENRAPPKKP